jgi:hypothetical protein
VSEILDNRVVCLVARKGGGKSYQLRTLLAREKNSVVVFDVRREYGKDSRDAKLFAVDRECLTIEEMEDALREAEDERKGIAVSFVPDDPKEDISEFCRVLFRHYYGLTIAFEETPSYTEPGFMPRQMEQLVLQARHKRHNLYFVGQRYAEMSRSLTAQCDYHCIGSTKEPNDLKALESRIGTEATARVAALEKRSFITFDVEAQEIHEGISIPDVKKMTAKEKEKLSNGIDTGREEEEIRSEERDS